MSYTKSLLNIPIYFGICQFMCQVDTYHSCGDTSLTQSIFYFACGLLPACAAACARHLQGPGVAALGRSRHHHHHHHHRGRSCKQLHSPRSHRPQDHAAAEAWVHVGWPGAGAAAQPAMAAAVAGAEGDWAVADVGARAPQLAVEAAVPSHQCRLRVLAPLHPACMWQIRAWLDLQHVSNVNQF
jgi:hypothetical protein